MKKAHILVGIPATGKSTYRDKILADNTDAYIYSTDDNLEKIAKTLGTTYDMVFEDHYKDAYEQARDGLDAATKVGQDVIFDQTNLTEKKRHHIIQSMSQKDYWISCVSIDIPFSQYDVTEWEKRLAGREGKHIPHFVINSMLDSYTKPTMKEGFDELYNMDMWGGDV